MEALQPLSHDPDELFRLATATITPENDFYLRRQRFQSDFVTLFMKRRERSTRTLIRKAFSMIDGFFFQCTLSKHGVRPSLRHRTVWFPSSQSYLSGHYDNKQITVYKYVSEEGKCVSPEDMLSTLIHEMVHAYYCLFSDPQRYQDKVDLNFGHGMLWNALFHTIINIMCQWSPTMAALAALNDENGCAQDIHYRERMVYPLDDDDDSVPSDEDGRETHRLLLCNARITKSKSYDAVPRPSTTSIRHAVGNTNTGALACLLTWIMRSLPLFGFGLYLGMRLL
jgi:hypothetical protein